MAGMTTRRNSPFSPFSEKFDAEILPSPFIGEEENGGKKRRPEKDPFDARVVCPDCQHLAQRAHLAVGADGDHVVAPPGRLAVVLQGARAVGLLPDLLGLAKARTYVLLGRDALFQLADALLVAARQQGEHGQQGGARALEPVV